MVAESYARIFYRNSINGGYLVPVQTPQRLVDLISTGAEVRLDMAAGTLTDIAAGAVYNLLPSGDVTEIIDAGGIFGYAREKGLL